MASGVFYPNNEKHQGLNQGTKTQRNLWTHLCPHGTAFAGYVHRRRALASRLLTGPTMAYKMMAMALIATSAPVRQQRPRNQIAQSRETLLSLCGQTCAGGRGQPPCDRHQAAGLEARPRGHVRGRIGQPDEWHEEGRHHDVDEPEGLRGRLRRCCRVHRLPARRGHCVRDES